MDGEQLICSVNPPKTLYVLSIDLMSWNIVSQDGIHHLYDMYARAQAHVNTQGGYTVY